MAKLFESMPPRASRDSDLAVVSKASSSKASMPSIKGGTGIYNRIAAISSVVTTKLGKYASKYVLLRDEQSVKEYFNAICVNGCGAIDTETDSLDPILCKIAGICLYTPGQKPAYLPLNHVSYITGQKVSGQVEAEVVRVCLLEATACAVKWYMHNGKFDIRVLKNKMDVLVACHWDTLLAAKCLNENEPAGLKALHLHYCESEDAEALTYESLFDGIPFTQVPINVGYLYAAGDALKTFELGLFQEQWLNEEFLPGPYYVFRNIEMPLVPVVAEIEDTGIALDLVYAQEIGEKYRAQLAEREDVFYETLKEYKEQIDAYCRRTPKAKLSSPISIYSPVQMAILFYDILGCTSNDKKKPRGTGKKILASFDLPIAKAALACKETQKLLTTYIEKMPKILNPITGRIHCSFNQYGAATGRFSSSEPNMQNIPSHNKDIRKMFVASPGCVLISCDFSQQEPRTLAHMSGDFNLIQAYCDGKDIYAWIASSIYRVDYDECREKRQDGSSNPEGKKRRDSVKSIILGIMYGRGAKAIGEQLGISAKEAQKIIDMFFQTYPSVKAWMDGVVRAAKESGFVSTAWGRKRRLPDVRLPDYSLSYTETMHIPANFDPLDFNALACVEDNYVDDATVADYTYKLNRVRGYKDKLIIIQQAKEQGINIVDNTMKIADAERQCVNSIIQGSSADMTKIAMRLIGEDDFVSSHRGRMIIQVHDEIIVEAPKEHANDVARRVSELMVFAASERITVPMKCDAEITEKWYGAAFDAEAFVLADDD